MGLFAWTSSTIFILTLVSISFMHSFITQRAMTSYLSQEVSALEKHAFFDLSAKIRNTYFYKANATATSEREALKEKTSVPKKPRLTSKLHISPKIITELRNMSDVDQLTSPEARLFFQLMERLYPGIGSLLQLSDHETLSLVVRGLAEALLRYEGKFSTAHASILANFEMPNPLIQEALWNILHGRTKESQEWPSLLSFISFKKEKHLISLWLAPRKVLEAIFENDGVVEEIIEKKYSLQKNIRKQNSKENDQMASLEMEWRALCEKNLPSWLPANKVDLKISKTRSKA